jgi:hypothetical protein
VIEIIKNFKLSGEDFWSGEKRMFCPAQIICIDRSADSLSTENLLLLAEVIQMVPERARC